MKAELKIHLSNTLSGFVNLLHASGRTLLYSVAAENLHRLVQNHLARLAPARHATAERLGARATGHLEKGVSSSSFSYDDHHAEVVIPVPGINRAFHDVEIKPRFASALTLPLHGDAYAHRVAELKRMGWNIFRPKGKNVIMGTRDGKTLPLYALKKRVHQCQDRSLLPSDGEINSTVARAMMAEILRIQKLEKEK